MSEIILDKNLLKQEKSRKRKEREGRRHEHTVCNEGHVSRETNGMKEERNVRRKKRKVSE